MSVNRINWLWQQSQARIAQVLTTSELFEHEALYTRALIVFSVADFEVQLKDAYESFFLKKTHTIAPIPNRQTNNHRKLLYRGLKFDQLIFSLELANLPLAHYVKQRWNGTNEQSALTLLVQDRHYIAHGEESRITVSYSDCLIRVNESTVLVSDIVQRINAL